MSIQKYVFVLYGMHFHISCMKRAGEGGVFLTTKIRKFHLLNMRLFYSIVVSYASLNVHKLQQLEEFGPSDQHYPLSRNLKCPVWKAILLFILQFFNAL